MEARKAQILEGARRAFARHGYDGATVARLEEETGLSRGAIFHYFRDKKDLFVALAVDVNRRYLGLMADGGVDEAIRAVAHEDREWLGAFIETEVRLHHDEDFVRRLQEATSSLGEPALAWFHDEQAAGRLRGDVDARDLARFATMVLNGMALRVAGGDETDAESVVRLLEDALRPRT